MTISHHLKTAYVQMAHKMPSTTVITGFQTKHTSHHTCIFPHRYNLHCPKDDKILRHLRHDKKYSAARKASYTRVCQMVRELLPNGSQTKCVYVWIGLWTCAAPSANSLHTVRHEAKFVGFLHEYKENWMCWVSFLCTGYHLLASGSQKIINHAPNICRTRME